MRIIRMLPSGRASHPTGIIGLRTVEDSGEQRSEGRQTGGNDSDIQLNIVPYRVCVVIRVIWVIEDFGLENGFHDGCSACTIYMSAMIIVYLHEEIVQESEG